VARLPHAVFGLLFTACVVFLFTGADALRLAAGVIAVALMAVQTVRRPDARIAFGLLTIANGAWAIGDREAHASPTAPRVLAAPGPVVVIATPSLPVARA
jgi:hypothetical protein